jgi:hypothetical protein
MSVKPDLTSSDFKFISKKDEWFIEGSEVTCEGDFTDWNYDKLIEDGWGMFRGLTNEIYKGYDGPLPRLDGDTSSFSEFEIYWKETRIDGMTFDQLKELILSEERDQKINSLMD